ncbi:NepR family anti-sigma factor [Tanticharoenia sakaeratensis]|jgi:hypothetical protein|uniref:Anti-sigma factor NepR domain-containing protein n=1 Tax=Tanticharoenia sakaeratensis NBRC 103193 TaxID=1231623 RepID=A0A0D6MIG4_9PROT|nr:NepR family anti-sigma factor [Tanticharoenia sakaeratensis]GAN53417.1 hypothetical protein Tasa_009_212 [Tanticharoenia sakaeratensis NBRC 103193]GBQ20718.1 hypothetical protein AA103193_1476 [Tanticharoenia sakaeratensis NBRC 103193]
MNRGPGGEQPDPPNSDAPEDETAFGLWLRRGLHQLFDDVANEPIPEELLRLIEDDRDKTQS